MKKVLGLLLVMFTTSAWAEAEIKKVCYNEQKDGKTVKVCKVIKVHKKLEGTEVPEKTKK